ncbi:hypothetical protein PIIN_07806 [Serendipita indica DSM 11827]|uniref:Uncharacterized protein n=1 Tax=Serendipita indica (strain DSM 11827) TaxID=1109443 RepID=G4TRA9_SERID|nr:hypothetical protein PIIN_07806 [Serendipita indica DSM 11827]
MSMQHYCIQSYGWILLLCPRVSPVELVLATPYLPPLIAVDKTASICLAVVTHPQWTTLQLNGIQFNYGPDYTSDISQAILGFQNS